MLSDGVAYPDELTDLKNTLLAYCEQENIEHGSPDWEDAALLAMRMFRNDRVCSVETLRDAMSQRDR